MKVITKTVIIEDKKFVLVQDQNEKLKGIANYQDGIYYGTIPYAEIDEHGKMKRPLNGFEMCIQNTINEAIKQRLIQEKIKNFKLNNPNATDKEIIKKIMELQDKY